MLFFFVMSKLHFSTLYKCTLVEGKSKTVHGSLWGQREGDLGVKGTGILGERGMRGREVELLSHGRNKEERVQVEEQQMDDGMLPNTATLDKEYHGKDVESALS